MPLDPTKLTSDLIQQYSSYLRSRFHFRDEQLRRQFAEALSGDRPLHAGPFLELLPAFETTRTIREVAEAGVLHRRLLDLRSEAADLDRPLYRHQEEALQKIQAGRNVVVATGTGSGKTETYLLPIVSHLFETLNERSRKPAVRALLVYPMNALANDQLRRIRQGSWNALNGELAIHDDERPLVVDERRPDLTPFRSARLGHHSFAERFEDFGYRCVTIVGSVQSSRIAELRLQLRHDFVGGGSPSFLQRRNFGHQLVDRHIRCERAIAERHGNLA